MLNELVALSVFAGIFGMFRALIEVDLIEVLHKKIFEMNWDNYQYIHAIFCAIVMFPVSLLLGLGISKSILATIAVVWLYGVVLDTFYFLIRMLLLDTSWKYEIEYMTPWVNQAPISGFVTIGKTKMPKWYLTNLALYLFFMIGVVLI